MVVLNHVLKDKPVSINSIEAIETKSQNRKCTTSWAQRKVVLFYVLWRFCELISVVRQHYNGFSQAYECGVKEW